MKETKFRAWDKNNNQMFYNVEEGKEYIDLYECVQPFDFFLNNEGIILMQFTGLLDKNKKEIFEGDLLKNDQDKIFVVKFGKLPLDKAGDCVCTYEAFYCYDGSYNRFHECQEIRDWMEVIGNIYENPELLEEAK